MTIHPSLLSSHKVYYGHIDCMYSEGRITYAWIKNEDGTLTVACSFCNPFDNFCKETGRFNAKVRLGWPSHRAIIRDKTSGENYRDTNRLIVLNFLYGHKKMDFFLHHTHQRKLDLEVIKDNIPMPFWAKRRYA